VEPTAKGYEVRYRMDGLLETVARHDAATGRGIVGRLMVMGHLLTYRLDVPQEGRISTPLPATGMAGPVDLRLAIMPTTHGLRAAVRMPAELIQPRSLEELGLPPAALDGLCGFADADAGMLIVTGPAGSGKTTTIYALLEHIARTSPGLSIIALEDPVERDLPGVTQIEVSPFGELTYERSLRSILRQDPQVLALGEIRDAATASLALQAALSGHRLVCTFHAASPGGAIARLIEMGMEPYQVTSALYGVLAQRLLRKRNPDGPGYRGRVPVAELAVMNAEVREAVMRRSDADTIQRLIAVRPGHLSLRKSAQALVESGVTDIEEVGRVVGPDGT
jgi:type II secretory ATPase GspE/PulE/Tfp pilus assembly ATPase PilB-like protein